MNQTIDKDKLDVNVDILNANYGKKVKFNSINFTTANENNSESLFEVQFSRSAGGVDLGWGGAPAVGWGKTSARAITYGPRAFGWTDVQPTFTLFNEYKQEKTTANTTDPRLDATMFYNKPGGMQLYGQDFATKYATNSGDLNDLFCRKYQNSDGQKVDEFDWRSGINERLLRYADILLMYAECLNETGDTPGAYTYIQMVRSRVGLPNLATAKPSMDQNAMREQIGHERFLEFPLEGHRFDDIRRWGWLQDPAKLAWLKAQSPENTCRILSNVRCLSEGVDVPSLDAVLFLTPRNSQVDVVQSVGRVMRNAPGKKRGYVVLPVVIPAGVEPHNALNDNKTYAVVWQVLQALRSHSSRRMVDKQHV